MVGEEGLALSLLEMIVLLASLGLIRRFWRLVIIGEGIVCNWQMWPRFVVVGAVCRLVKSNEMLMDLMDLITVLR